MTSKRRKYKNIDEILDFVMNESDEDLLLEDDNNNSESNWECEDGQDITFVPQTLENDQEMTRGN